MDERFTLIADLIACLYLSPVNPLFSLENLLSHPAVADYPCLQGLGCDVSDFFDTYQGDGSNPGYVVLRAVEEASGNEFLNWWGKFDPAGAVHFNQNPHTRPSRGPLNALDRTHSLQFAIRAFRNRTVHRSDFLDRLYGSTADQWMRTWVTNVPQMWTRLWRCLVMSNLTHHFPSYFRYLSQVIE